ncbi:hypothetical protein KR100_07030 [Synechococcus sp. KORDI-100]|nr:hypothetical protein KR100_07030 [Synechococcus sp. KORDI-100]
MLSSASRVHGERLQWIKHQKVFFLDQSPRQRLNSLIAKRWSDIGEPSLLHQHKYAVLLRSIRREKQLVAVQLIDLMLQDASSKLIASAPLGQ